MNCPWCKNYDAATGDEDPRDLCRSHLAEYEGLSEDELDRMEYEQAFEASGR
jgi:pyruvate-formate lyase-activating enzyme